MASQITKIADLWVPDVWVMGLKERIASFPSFFTSKSVSKSPMADALANGAGLTGQLPFIKDFSDTVDQIQVESTAPETNKITSGKQIATIMNRVTPFSAAALAAQVSGADPVSDILNGLFFTRMKQRNASLISMLRGIFGNALTVSTTPATSTALKNVDARNAVITGTPAAGNYISSTQFLLEIGRLGEVVSGLLRGVLVCHPIIKQKLIAMDESSYQIIPSQNGSMEVYKGFQILTSNSLVTAVPATSLSIYETYVLGEGVFSYGEKPQVGDQIDVASLQLFLNKQTNDTEIYDRTRFVMHPEGVSFTGTPSGQSVTNAELATTGNWTLATQSADRCGMVRILTNG